MTAKYFCDKCEKELRKVDQGRFITSDGDLKIEIIHTYEGTANAGHICHACIKRVVAKGKPERDGIHTRNHGV